MIDSVKEAIKDLSDDAFMLESGAGNNISTPKKMAAQIRLLITAAEEAEAMQCILEESIKNCDELCDEVNKLRARIASLEKDRPEVVTVGELVGMGNGIDTLDAIWLSRSYPQGIRIVQDKEGG